MQIKSKDKVVDKTTGKQAVVIATHTYPEGTQIASIDTGKEKKWVPVSELTKVS